MSVIVFDMDAVDLLAIVSETQTVAGFMGTGLCAIASMLISNTQQGFQWSS